VFKPSYFVYLPETDRVLPKDPFTRGTTSSNPFPSSGESANFRSLSASWPQSTRILQIRVDIGKAGQDCKAAPVDLNCIAVIGQQIRDNRGDCVAFDRQIDIAAIAMGLPGFVPGDEPGDVANNYFPGQGWFAAAARPQAALPPAQKQDTDTGRSARAAAKST